MLPPASSGPVVLITRPRLDAQDFAALLQKEGFSPLQMPLAQVRFLEKDPGERQKLRSALARSKAVMITSANGVRALTRLLTPHEIKKITQPVYCVGQASAAHARLAGFPTIFCPMEAGGARELITFMGKEKIAGSILHPCAQGVAGMTERLMTEADLTYQGYPVYRSLYRKTLSPLVKKTWRAGEIDAITFFSPRQAAVFSELVRKMPALSIPFAVCISPAIAARLDTKVFQSVKVASKPSTSEMMGLLRDIFRVRTHKIHSFCWSRKVKIQ